MFKKIVVPVDGSENSMRAVDYALELGKKFEGELMVVNVVTPHDRAAEIRNEVEAVRISSDKKAERAKKALQLAEERVEKLGGYTKVKYTPLAGSDPADTIIEAAEEQGADTIVIGNRGL